MNRQSWSEPVDWSDSMQIQASEGLLIKVRVCTVQKERGHEGKEEGKVNPKIKGGVAWEDRKYTSAQGLKAVLFPPNHFFLTIFAALFILHTTGLETVSHWLMDTP